MAFAACVVTGLASCTPHPVGPARTYDKYRGKAVTTAESALSVAQTVQLIADAASKDNSFGPYTSVALSDQEDSINGLQGTFGSIQPPNPPATRLRNELDALLSRAVEGVTDVRIAARQGRLRELGDEAAPLGEVSDALQRFIEANQK